MKKKQYRKRRMIPRAPRKNFSQPEWASCTEVVRGSVLTTNLIYGPNEVSLDLFKRASQIAANFQQYRITGVKLRFTPRFDTFPANANAATAYSIPYLYYLIDRVGAIRDSVSLNELRSMGARPHRFDDKTIVVSYKPGVKVAVSAANTTAVSPQRYIMSPWLSTQALEPSEAPQVSDTDHFGIWWCLDAKSIEGDGAYEYDVDVEVNFQFRKALIFTPEAVTSDKHGGSVFAPKSI